MVAGITDVAAFPGRLNRKVRGLHLILISLAGVAAGAYT
jgi:hypothetical protein